MIDALGRRFPKLALHQNPREDAQRNRREDFARLLAAGLMDFDGNDVFPVFSPVADLIFVRQQN